MKAAKTKAKKIDFHQALRDAAQSMVRLKRPERLLKMIIRFIDSEVGLTHTSILVLEEKKHRFIFTDSKGSRRFPLGLVKIDLDYPLVDWFQHLKGKLKIHDNFLYLPTVEQWCRNGKLKQQAPALEKVRKAMSDFKAELVVPGYYKKSLLGILLLGKKVNGRQFTPSEISFFQILTQDCSMAIKNAQFYQDLSSQNQELARRVKEIEGLRKKEQETYYQIMRSLAQQVHAKDPYTFGHINQVERLGMMVAKEMKLDLSGKKRDILSAGLTLHDVGKIGIPDHILKKPARLNPEEWAMMKTHVEKGVKILEPLTDFQEVAEIVHCHHENFDGSGYPRGLKGEQIPIGARIVTVVDAFHAIVSTRCYDPARPFAAAFKELRRCAGAQFDPEVVEAFIHAMQQDMKKRGVDVILDEVDQELADTA